MDQRTLEVYRALAEEKIKFWDSINSNLDEVFEVVFKNSHNVLDIGFGSGRDIRYLINKGFEVYGVDPCRIFVNKIKASLPGYSNRFHLDSLPGLSSQDKKTGFYDTVIMNAVLMHMLEEEIFEAVSAIKRILKPGGRLFISIPERMEGIDPKTHRTPEGLIYNLYSPNRIASIFSPLGFIMIYKKRSEDRFNRNDRIWSTMIFELEIKT
jgi:SAM-dependent methyltransferase